MVTSSAHPDRLASYRTALEAVARRAEDVVDDTTAALHSYRATCPDGEATPAVALVLARATLDMARAHALAVGQIGTAFAEADHGNLAAAVGQPARLGDLDLGRYLAQRYPGLVTGVLLEPLRAHEQRGTGTGAAVAEATRRGDIIGAGRLLLDATDPDVADPTYAAALLNELGADELVALTEGLALVTTEGPMAPTPPLERLGELHRAASLTWEGGWSHGTVLSPVLLAQMLTSATGRNAVRALTAIPGQRPGRAHLAEVVGPLLVDSRANTDGATTALSHFLAAGPVEPDAHLLAIVSDEPDVALHLLAGTGHPNALATAHAGAGPEARDALAQVSATALGHPTVSGPANATARGLVLTDVVETAAADPRAVRPAMAEVVAGSMWSDPTFWTGAADGPTGASMPGAFEAVARHEEPLMGLLIAVDAHEQAVVSDLVSPDPHFGRSELTKLDFVQGHLRAGAEAADIPDDDWRWAADAAHWSVDTAQKFVPESKQVAAAVARPVLHGAIDQAHRLSMGDPGTSLDKVEDQQHRRRRNAWIAVAGDPAFADALMWDVADSGISSMADLHGLDGSTESGLGLRIWADGQPAEIRELVESFALQAAPPATGTGR
ncbi:hypothetical protein BH23ACT2_BH23ACT2_19580 [soil metagenome]